MSIQRKKIKKGKYCIMRAVFQQKENDVSGTCEPLEDHGPMVKQLMVLYCLHSGCKLTCYREVGEWEVSAARLEQIESGGLSMMSPYCPDHEKEVRKRSA